jgi:uncharacterized caspase-like protein
MSSLALLVGVDAYPTTPLSGCVHDAIRMQEKLAKHHDNTPNFSCRRLVSSETTVTRSVLREHIESLFAKPADIALLFFAGHGTENNLGGYLMTQDAKRYDEGVRMADVLELANRSPARERIIVLDCCHSGAFGSLPAIDNKALLAEGVSVLAACRDTEYAVEAGREGGLFTTLGRRQSIGVPHKGSPFTGQVAQIMQPGLLATMPLKKSRPPGRPLQQR